MASSSYRGYLSSHNHVTDVSHPGAYAQQSKRDSLDPVIFIDLPDRNQNDRPVATPAGPSREDRIDQRDRVGQQYRVDQQYPVDQQDRVVQQGRLVQQNRFVQQDRTCQEHVSQEVRLDRNDRKVRPKPEPLPQIFVTLPEEAEEGQARPYGRAVSAEDDFSLSPLPLADFPDPPPSYGEVVDLDRSRLPRTTVITMNAPPSKDKYRRHLLCQHCNRQVHTVVCRQIGPVTHALAILFLLTCLFPLTILVYCIDTFKSRMHYCPACSKAIGREEPFVCTEMVYATR